MSWNFVKAGTIKEALKAAVQAEFAPPSIKDEVCARIDGMPDHEKNVIVAESYGHIDTDPARQWRGADTIFIRVRTMPLLNTPAEVQS